MADSFPSPIPEAISLANEVSPGLGAQLRTAATQMWGDPAAIRTLSRSWAALAARVDHSAGDAGAEIRALDRDWEGTAADAYRHWMRTLNEDSIQVLSGQFRQISTILDGTADDVSGMNQRFADLCFHFIVTLGSLSESGLQQPKMAAALLAGVKFGDQINQFRNTYTEKLRPRTQALQQIATGINNGSIGQNIQHLPDASHPDLYYTRDFADRYQWNILGDWRNWKMKHSSR